MVLSGGAGYLGCGRSLEPSEKMKRTTAPLMYENTERVCAMMVVTGAPGLGGGMQVARFPSPGLTGSRREERRGSVGAQDMARRA